MPILTANGDHLCAECGRERRIKQNEWLTDPIDPTVFTSPPCPCGAQETFCWHDTVYTSRKSEEREVPPEHPNGPKRTMVLEWEEPDPDTYDARHMVQVGKVALSLGLKRRQLHNNGHAYPKEPRAFTQAEMREQAEKRKPKVLPSPTKEEAEKEHAKAVASAKAQLQRKAKELGI